MASLLGEELHMLDPVGIRDGSLMLPTRHAMFELRERILTEDSLVLKGTIIAPEGSGSRSFGRVDVHVPADRAFLDDQEIEWSVMKPLPPLHVKLWIFHIDDVDLGCGNTQTLRMGYRYTDDSSWAKVPNPSDDDQSFRCLELFAGGFGGWSAAWSILTELTQRQFHTMAIEKDTDIAKTYALSRSACFVPHNAQLDQFSFETGQWVINMSVEDQHLLKTMVEYEPHVATLSAPCPPWSAASYSPGLGDEEGLLLPKSLGLMRWIRPKILLIEQVQGFSQHQHFGVVLDLLRMLGYSLIWHRVVDLSHQTQAARPRWLGMAVRVQATVHICHFQMWPKFDDWQPCRMQLTNDQLQELIPTAEVLSVAGEFRYVKNPKRNMDRSPQAVLNMRIYNDDEKLPTVMAKYGTQHLFSDAFLAERGYFGFFLRAPELHAGCRFFSPAELAVMHGVWKQTYLPFQLVDAWKILGNQIAIPHALLMTTNAARFLGIDIEITEAFEFYHAQKLAFQHSKLCTLPGGYMLTSQESEPSSRQADIVAELLGTRAFTPKEFWSYTHGVCEVSNPQVMIEATAISQPPQDASDDDDSQHPSRAIMKGMVHFGENQQEFWFSAALTALELEDVWSDMFNAEFCPERIPSLHMRKKENFASNPVFADGYVVASVDGQTLILKCDTDRPILEQAFLLGIPLCESVIVLG
eukprot:Skav232369  [mRNA]  locus=scaffold1077:11266:13347:+ [translate_table: standard]